MTGMMYLGKVLLSVLFGGCAFLVLVWGVFEISRNNWIDAAMPFMISVAAFCWYIDRTIDVWRRR